MKTIRSSNMKPATLPSKGVTLIELLVVILMLALAVSLVAPRVSPALEGFTEKAEVRRMASVLRHARHRAVMHGETVAVTLDTEKRRFLSSDADPVAWPEGLELMVADNGAYSPTLEFYPDGGANGGIVNINGQHERYRLQVDWLTGRVSIEQ